MAQRLHYLNSTVTPFYTHLLDNHWPYTYMPVLIELLDYIRKRNLNKGMFSHYLGATNQHYIPTLFHFPNGFDFTANPVSGKTKMNTLL